MRSHAKAPAAAPTRTIAGTSALLVCLLCVLGISASSASAAPPTVTIDSASEIGFTTAKATGEVAAEGKETSYRFEYLSDQQFDENEANTLPPFEGAAQVGFGSVEAAGTAAPEVLLEGLVSGTEYHLRLVAENEDGQDIDVAPNFTTQTATAPVVNVDAPTGIGFTKAHVTGSIDPEGGNENPGAAAPLTIGWELQLSTTPGENFGGYTGGGIEGPEAESSSPIETPSGGFTFEGLAPGTTYYYRLVAYNAGKQVISSEQGFETEGPITAPLVEIEAASGITGTSAHFKGKVTAGEEDPGFNANCEFDYVPLPRSERQRLKVEASEGTYKLRFEGQETTSIAFDAAPADIDSALEALAAIGPGNVAVSGGNGIHPYLIAFGGALGGKDVGQIEVNDAIPNTFPVKHLLVGTATATTSVQGSDGSFANPAHAACDVNPVTGTDPVTVQADPTGLEPNTTYHLRLRAENQGGTETDEAADFTTEAVAPAIIDTAATGVGTTSATLSAEINPGGDPTTYYFEYLTLAEYEEGGGSFTGATSTPESASIGADNEGHAADAQLSALVPGTVYRYRVVATNSKAPAGIASGVRSLKTAEAVAPGESCPNAAVRAQQGSTYLPECRAYEMVNPGTDDIGEVNRMPYASKDGNTMSYMSIIPGDDALGGAVAAISVARRTAGGWTSESADPISTGAIGEHTGLTYLKGFSTDFSRELVITSIPGQADDIDYNEDAYSVLVGKGTATNLTDGLGTFPERVAAATPDLSKVLVNMADGSKTGTTIYVTDGITAEPVSVEYPDGLEGDGGPLPAGANYDRGLEVPGKDSSAPFLEDGGQHVMSDDGKYAYFYRQRASSTDLLVRDLASNPPQTIPVSISSRSGDVGTLYTGAFIAASRDGNTAYFVSAGQLTDDATPGGGIYRFDLQSETVTQVTPDANDPSGLHVGDAIVSGDLSHIYFTSRSVLTGGAQAGDTNAYVWTDAGGVRFIAAMEPGELPQVRRVTPDGRYALLVSKTSIDGAPNNGHTAIYRYDDATGEIVCASCRADGSPSMGNSVLDGQSFGFPGSPQGEGLAPLAPNRGLTADGRVLFMSTDQIVARDQTSKADVYLYRDGAPALLTSGTDNTENSYIGDISEDGRNISVITRAALVPSDRDPAEFDVYDVREGGGFLEPTQSAPCEGEACRSAGSSPPSTASATTQTFVGPGNPKPCAKGKIRRNGRCVKPPKHHKKRAGKTHQREANTNRRAGR